MSIFWGKKSAKIKQLGIRVRVYAVCNDRQGVGYAATVPSGIAILNRRGDKVRAHEPCLDYGTGHLARAIIAYSHPRHRFLDAHRRRSIPRVLKATLLLAASHKPAARSLSGNVALNAQLRLQPRPLHIRRARRLTVPHQKFVRRSPKKDRRLALAEPEPERQ